MRNILINISVAYFLRQVLGLSPLKGGSNPKSKWDNDHDNPAVRCVVEKCSPLDKRRTANRRMDRMAKMQEMDTSNEYWQAGVFFSLKLWNNNIFSTKMPYVNDQPPINTSFLSVEVYLLKVITTHLSCSCILLTCFSIMNRTQSLLLLASLAFLLPVLWRPVGPLHSYFCVAIIV